MNVPKALDSPARLMTTAISIGLMLATILTYLPAMWCEFLEWDDPGYVTNNAHVAAGLTPNSIFYAFTTFDTHNWIPLTWLSYELDASIFGSSSAGFHATNVAIHALNVWLLFLVLNRMTCSTIRSAIVALFFGIHPLHVESVAWVSERKDVLSTFWLLATLLMYERYARQPTNSRLAATGLLMVLGLLSKSMLVTLPILMLLLDIWPLRRITESNLILSGQQESRYPCLPCWKVLLEKLPLLLISFIAGIMTLIAQRQAMAKESTMPVASRVGNAINATGWYLWKTVFPTGLCAFYQHPVMGISWLQVGFVGSLLVFISAVVVVLSKRRPWLLVGWLWFLVALLPVLGLLQVGTQAQADRYTYIPHVGLFILIVWGLHDWLVRIRGGLAIGVSLLLLASGTCIGLTRAQILTWHDTVTLWSHVLTVEPTNYCALRGLGIEELKGHRLGAAETKLLAAIDSCPDDGISLYWLGRIYCELEEWDRAGQCFSWALRINPYHANAAQDLAAVSQKVLPQSPRDVGHAASPAPEPAALKHVRLGLKIARQQFASRADFKRALLEFDEAIRIDPAYAGAHVNAAITCRELGRLDDAIQHMHRVLELEPDRAKHHSDLAQLQELNGQFQESISHYNAALKLDPTDLEAQIRLKRALRLSHSQ